MLIKLAAVLLVIGLFKWLGLWAAIIPLVILVVIEIYLRITTGEWTS